MDIRNAIVEPDRQNEFRRSSISRVDQAIEDAPRCGKKKAD